MLPANTVIRKLSQLKVLSGGSCRLPLYLRGVLKPAVLPNANIVSRQGVLSTMTSVFVTDGVTIMIRYLEIKCRILVTNDTKIAEENL